jgi:hypothetical protein
MNCWTVLGIKASKNKRTIKKAYAQALKYTRPDDDAHAFQRLHFAYQSALDELKAADFSDTSQWLSDQLTEFESSAKYSINKQETLACVASLYQADDVLQSYDEKLENSGRICNNLKARHFIQQRPVQRVYAVSPFSTRMKR